MKIEHTALWTEDLERSRAFYEAYFGAAAGARYENPAHGFASYFLRFPGGATRLELMQGRGIAPRAALPDGAQALGWAHLAFEVGTADDVDALTRRIAADGFRVLDGPRRTGDGYYESVVADPDGNRIEVTAA